MRSSLDPHLSRNLKSQVFLDCVYLSEQSRYRSLVRQTIFLLVLCVSVVISYLAG
ncbi:MAG: hypothetical protein AAGF24_05845 [Cyanobacteria bacterium P01_H01_bin.121]